MRTQVAAWERETSVQAALSDARQRLLDNESHMGQLAQAVEAMAAEKAAAMLSAAVEVSALRGDLSMAEEDVTAAHLR